MEDQTNRDKLKQYCVYRYIQSHRIMNDYLQSRGYSCSNTTLQYDTSIASYINDQLNDTSDIIGEGSGLILSFHCHISTLQTQYKEYLGIQLIPQPNSKEYPKFLKNLINNFSFSLFALIALLIYESDETEKATQFFTENSKDYDMDYVEHIEVLKRYMNNKKDISKSKCHIPLMKSILNKHIELQIPIDFYNKLIEELSNRSLLYLLYLIENCFEFIFIDDSDEIVEDCFDYSDFGIELSSISNNNNSQSLLSLSMQPQQQQEPPPSPPLPIQQQQQQQSQSSSSIPIPLQSNLTFPNTISSSSSSSTLLYQSQIPIPQEPSQQLQPLLSSSSTFYSSPSTSSSPDPFSVSPMFVNPPSPYPNNIPIPLSPYSSQDQQSQSEIIPLPQLPPPQQQQQQQQQQQNTNTVLNANNNNNKLWGEIEENNNNYYYYQINQPSLSLIPSPTAPNSISFPYSTLNYDFTSPHNLITSMKISHNNKIIICGYVNGIIEYWNKINEPKSNSHKLYGLSSTVLSIDIDYNNEYIIGSDVCGSIMMWSLTSNQSMAIVKYQGHTSAVFSIKFSPVNYYFASGGHDTTVQIWRTDTYNSLRLFTGHLCEISCLEWFNNGVYLISGDYSGVIRIWDSIKGICTRHLLMCDIRISCINVSLNGKYISFGNDNSEIIIYEIEKGTFFKHQLPVKNKTINSVLLLENDNILLYCTNNRLYVSSITLNSNSINLNSTQIVSNNSSHIFTLSYNKHHHHILLCSVNF